MLFTKVAVVAPSIEVIVAAQSVNIGRELVASGEGGMLVCMNREGLATTSHFPFPSAYRNRRRVSCLVDLEAVVAGTKQIESQIWRIDLYPFVLIEVAHVNTQRPFAELNLCHIVGQIQKRKTRLTPEPDCSRPDVQLGSGIPVSPQFVASSHRPVSQGRDPIVSSCRLKGH